MSYGVDKATACTRRDALLDQKASSYAAPQRGSEQSAQGNALGMQDGEILALKGQKH